MELTGVAWRTLIPPLVFNALFWTPFWLFGLFAGEPLYANLSFHDALSFMLSRAAAGLLVSAGLVAIAELCGRHRRFFFLAMGALCFVGAEIWLLFLYASSEPVNAYTITTAVAYLIGDGSELSYLTLSPWVLLPMAACALPFVLLARSWEKLDWPTSKPLVVAATLTTLCLIPLDLARAYFIFGPDFLQQNKPLYRADDFVPFEVYYRFQEYLVLRRQLVTYQTQAPLLAPRPHRSPLTLIVLVGESTPRRHMGLYGYCRNTTPRLAARAGELVVLENMISTIPLTTLALQRVFRLPSVPTHAGTAASTLFILLNKSGFDTFWLSNQYNYDSRADILTTVTRTTDHQIWARHYDPTTGSWSSDSILLPHLRQILAQPTRDKAIFLHLMGTHYTYSDRYPKNFQHPAWPVLGGARDPAAQTQIDNFDTAMLFQDKVITEAIDAAQNAGGNVALLYFSDHGEEVFDQYPLATHTYPSATRTMLEIPFLAWLSPGLKRDEPGLLATLQSLRHVRLQLNDIAPLILDIAGIEVRGGALSHPLKPGFRSGVRWVGGYDYDINPDLGRQPQLPPLCPPVRAVRAPERP